MEKNQFLMINNLIYNIYSWKNITDINDDFFQHLKMIIPFSYASLFLLDKNSNNKFMLSSPICYPDSFSEAEEEYINQADNDYLLWILHVKESNIVRESDIIDEEHRLKSSLYLNCYRKFNILDSLQLTIVYHEKFYGVLSLFRTRADGIFSNDDLFYLKSIGIHLNVIIHELLESKISRMVNSNSILLLKKKYELTEKEIEILNLLFEFKDNKEIANALDIRENTLQKHLQNLFRKLKVNSRWELIRIYFNKLH